MALLDDVKVACYVTVTAYDDELSDLIEAAFADLGITDIDSSMLTATDTDPLIKTAVKTFCKLHFCQLEASEYDRTKASYDEQKSQMLMSSSYTTWG